VAASLAIALRFSALVDLTVVIANHNTAGFLEVSLRALEALTRRPFQVLVNDDGSDAADIERLESLARRHEFVQLFHRPAEGGGSQAHGEALDFLIAKVRTPWTAVLDADCTPLLEGWDEYLIGQLDGTTKVVGSALGEGWSGNKPTDFPLPFLALFETDTYRELGISALPADRSKGQDTCWEWREKHLAAGYRGKCLESVNTRFTPREPFADVICGLYYTDDGRLIGSHFGRGSNPAARDLPARGRLRRRLRRRPAAGALQPSAGDFAEWTRICLELIRREAPQADAVRPQADR
jgi:glycosyltransferase involved in cell wall biosynthesis